MKQHAGKAHHVTDADAGTTLAAFLRPRLGNAAWSQVHPLVRGRQVLVHGNLCTDAARRLKVGEVVKVLDAPAAAPPRADDVRVVHLDDDVVVVEKPTGLTTTRHHEEASWPAKRRQLQPTLDELVPAAIARFLAERRRGRQPGEPAGGRPTRRRVPPVRAVHRIDRETSGLVVFARNVPASRILAEQFRLHTTHRRYFAIVAGRVKAATIRSRLVRDRGDGRRGSLDATGRVMKSRAVKGGKARGTKSSGGNRHDAKDRAAHHDDEHEAEHEAGKEAVTHVAPLEHFGDVVTLVECRLETGRTHQIRIHLSERGHPVCGERVYATPARRARRPEPEVPRAPRVMLHAAELGFVHPVTGAELRFTSPLPADMRRLLATLRKHDASGSKDA
jgi:23S rRNA pseudouridine1911/1915/1917 synthase